MRLVISQDLNFDTLSQQCGVLQPGEYEDFTFTWSTSWFTPPGEITVEAVVDPAELCDDCWRGNNTGTITKILYDIYPFEEGWPVTPVGVIMQPPLLVNLDEDPELEVVVLSNTYLEAYDSDNTLLWRNDEVDLFPSSSPLAADLDEDDHTEILALTGSGDIALFNENGEDLFNLGGSLLTEFAVADMDSTPGLEMVVANHDTLILYSWDQSEQEFSVLKSLILDFDDSPYCVAILCSDINDDGYGETIYYCRFDGGSPGHDPFHAITVYDWVADSILSEREWDEGGQNVIPCAGILGGNAEIGFPMGGYDPLSAKEDSVPAQLLDPLSVDSILCEKGLVASGGVIFGLFADWRELVPGMDAFIVPAENQCLAWNVDGYPFPVGNWPITYDDAYEYSTSGISPPALGDLDNDGIADVISSTLRGENGLIVGLDYRGDPLISQDFPFTLPEGVEVSSGFSIADIDRDGKVEIVFGTDDGLLHCWELGSCSVGYAPWPQHRHDAGRSGVLPGEQP